MIVLSIMEREPSKVQAILLDPPEGADAVEVRLDALKRCEPSHWYPGAAASGRPVIATCRSVKEGGLFRGGERARRETLLAAARAGVAYVDVEFGSPLMDLLGEIAPAKAILSHHDTRRTPKASDLLALYRKMSSAPGAAAAKIVTTATRPQDVLEIRTLLQRAGGNRVLLAAFAMGPCGTASRILSSLWGGWATYVSLERGRETAPGQITLEEALHVYRVNDLDEETKLTGITGWPVHRSLSPVMHNAAYAHQGINFRYLPLAAPRTPGLTAFLSALHLRGASVTAPHKAAALRSLRAIEPRAKQIGAANTLVFGGRRVVGLNTDVEGVLKPLEALLDPAGRTVAVIGAGGAARAAAWGLSRAGADVIVSSRRESAGAKVARLGGGRWVALKRLARESYDVLINATPVGGDGRSLPVPRAAVKGSVVGDLVYRPLVTPLLRAARERGIAVFDGLDVLLAQGVEQYALMTGREAPEEVMRQAIRTAVAREEAAGG